MLCTCLCTIFVVHCICIIFSFSIEKPHTSTSSTVSICYLPSVLSMATINGINGIFSSEVSNWTPCSRLVFLTAFLKINGRQLPVANLVFQIIKIMCIGEMGWSPAHKVLRRKIILHSINQSFKTQVLI